MPERKGKLTGGDWERRANEYWDNWHRSARIAGEHQLRAEEAEAERDRYRDALERIAAWKGSDYYGDKCARIAREALDG